MHIYQVLSAFILYQEAGPILLTEQETFRLEASVVLRMILVLLENKFFNLCFDRLFPSLPLLDKLTEKDHFGSKKIKKNKTKEMPFEF